LNHVEATVEERAAYLRMANAKRRAENATDTEDDVDVSVADGDEDEGATGAEALTPERFAQLQAAEE
ncbi:hypothetical protein, partial [Gluconobacter kondonii]|uniref:hypothetical protein n=1 Tax=Gluconobacter kondonii TaxID=941463 RepID=UPI00223223EE